jgi:hypothetical protein
MPQTSRTNLQFVAGHPIHDEINLLVGLTRTTKITEAFRMTRDRHSRILIEQTRLGTAAGKALEENPPPWNAGLSYNL